MIIIDASVVNKIFLPNEEGYETAQEIIKNHIQKSEEILIPDLLFYEVANTLVTKSDIPIKRITESLEQLERLELFVSHPVVEDMIKIAKFASDYHVSVYDASYAVLALEKGCDFYTADSKFVKKVNIPFVKHLSEYSPKVN